MTGYNLENNLEQTKQNDSRAAFIKELVTTQISLWEALFRNRRLQPRPNSTLRAKAKTKNQLMTEMEDLGRKNGTQQEYDCCIDYGEK